MRPRIVLAVLLLPLGCAGLGPRRGAPAQAEFPPPKNDAELDARLNFLEERLDAGYLHAAAWYWGWLTIDGLSGISQIQDADQAREAGDRSRDIVNAVKSTVGVADILVIRPMPGRQGARPIRALPDGSHEEKLARLARGEEILRASADRVQANRSWGVHVGNFLFNLAGSAVLFGLGHSEAAGVTLATGAIGGEVQIWTEPWSGLRNLSDYQHLVESGHASTREPQPWHLAPARDGLALEMHF
ncbi:MAG TPA: hypothetical protein VMH82_08590 [Myxococcota bacterium]|nr:hypothetical protein [Myxococcota bacterium]